jgi:hypothetical protein
MMVYTKIPRKMTFRTFTSKKRAATWIKNHAEKVISVKFPSYVEGLIIVNHYMR